MEMISVLLVVALVFGICWLVDKGFTRLLRGKNRQPSDKAVRASKRYGALGIGLSILGLLGFFVGAAESPVLMIGGVIVLVMGIAVTMYYASYGIFYNENSFLFSSLGKKTVVHKYQDIQEQKLYLVQGGNIVVELILTDGTSISLQSTMEGIYPFLDTAFAGWCRQKGLAPESCDFHDPGKHWWFPHEKEEA